MIENGIMTQVELSYWFCDFLFVATMTCRPIILKMLSTFLYHATQPYKFSKSFWLTLSFVTSFASGSRHFDFGLVWNCQWIICICVRVLLEMTSYSLKKAPAIFNYLRQKFHIDLLWSLCRENAGLLALTRVGSRRVVQISAGFMIFFSILGQFLVTIFCSNLILLHKNFGYLSVNFLSLSREIWSAFCFNSSTHYCCFILPFLCVCG